MSDDYDDEGEGGATKCEDCDGSEYDGSWGGKGDGVCSKCHGSGIHDQAQFWDVVDDVFGLDTKDPPCPKCNGSGQCPTCNGTGYI
jgi:DnaJ-class molecular chaperone